MHRLTIKINFLAQISYKNRICAYIHSYILTYTFLRIYGKLHVCPLDYVNIIQILIKYIKYNFEYSFSKIICPPLRFTFARVLYKSGKNYATCVLDRYGL